MESSLKAGVTDAWKRCTMIFADDETVKLLSDSKWKVEKKAKIAPPTDGTLARNETNKTEKVRT